MRNDVFEAVPLDFYRNDVAKALRKKGFCLGTKLLRDDFIEELKSKIGNFLSLAGKNGHAMVQDFGGQGAEEQLIQISKIWREVDEVAEIARQPVLHDIMAALCEEESEFYLAFDQLQYKPALRGGINAWHQDLEFWPFMEPYRQITAWLALDDVTIENGCMKMVPGSHQWGDATRFLKSLAYYYPLPGRYEGHEIVVENCVVPKGYVHFHQHYTWHGSGNNSSPVPRRAIAFHMMGGSTRYKARGGHTFRSFSEGDLLRSPTWPRIGDDFPPYATNPIQWT